MAFRPTIAVFINDEIADVGYYRNWMMKDLFIEAVGIALTYMDCRTIEEYRDRAFGRQEIRYVIEPETFENTQENLRWLLDCSEFPLTVDLTRRAIYCGDHMDDEHFCEIPDAEQIDIFRSGEEFYWELLDKHKITFDRIETDCVRDLFIKDSSIRSRLSVDTKKVMERVFRERIGEPDDEAGVYNQSR